MADDRLGEVVRIPQAASVASNRRKVLTLAVTAASQAFQLRAAPADSEAWVTLYCETPAVNLFLHGGSNAPTALPAATANDWPLPPQTERSFLLAHGETHVAIMGATATVKAYISGD